MRDPDRMAATKEAGQPSFLHTLVLAAPLFLLLGAAELWTQEGRWGLICQQMGRSGDFLHPSLLGEPYYGKPLLSYWLMLLAALPLGGLSEWCLRLPSAIAGLVTLLATIRIGATLLDRATGWLAGAMLGSTYMFVFWGRVASADMLQVAGVTTAVWWYVEHRERTDWRAYLGFGAILAVASLLKSPAAAVMALLAIAPDLWQSSRWRAHANLRAGAAAVAAAALFLLPFVWARTTAVVGQDQASLWTLFRENVVRYFAPFDHGGPIWLYLVQLPVYLLPWSLWLPWYAWRAYTQRSALDRNARWLLSALVLIFLFLTGCGSRRSYYILPVLPLCCLLLAHGLQTYAQHAHRRRQRTALAVIWALLLLWFGVAVPLSSSTDTTRRAFAHLVREVAESRAGWANWRVLSVDAVPAASYYLAAAEEPQVVERFDPEQVRAEIAAHPQTIVISRRRHLEGLRTLLSGCTLMEQPPPRFGSSREGGLDLLIAFLP
jgi:4-amino-4-deoxy-L-arabinose transferase-like glycosyltransferase